MIAPLPELFTLLYTSLLAPCAVVADVADIARTSRRRNREDAITGLLVFDGSSFAQLVEGSQQAIVDLRDRLVADRRHCDMDVLVFGYVGDVRRFPGWDLGYHFSDNEDDQLDSLRGLRGAAARAKFEAVCGRVDLFAEYALPSTQAGIRMRGVGKGAAKDSLTRILARRDIGMDVFGHCRVSKAAISAICRSRNQPNMRFRCRIPDHRTRRVARIYSP